VLGKNLNKIRTSERESARAIPGGASPESERSRYALKESIPFDENVFAAYLPEARRRGSFDY